jgi:hypothetical protein
MSCITTTTAALEPAHASSVHVMRFGIEFAALPCYEIACWLSREKWKKWKKKKSPNYREKPHKREEGTRKGRGNPGISGIAARRELELQLRSAERGHVRRIGPLIKDACIRFESDHHVPSQQVVLPAMLNPQK